MVNRKYRKRIKKTLAAALSVSLIMSSVSISSFASEAQENPNEPTIAVIVSEDENAAPVVTITVTETTNESTGNTTKTTVTESEWKEEETLAQETEAAEQETESTEQETGSTEQETESTSQETETEIQPGTTGGTIVTGSETKTENTVTNTKGQVIEESSNITGQETTTTEVTKTEVEKKEDQVIDTDTTPISSETTTDGDPELTTGKTETGDETFGAFGNGSWSDNEWVAGESNTDKAESESITVEDPLETQDVTLTLTPTKPTDSEKIYVDWSDIENNKVEIPKAGKENTTDAEGNPVVIETKVEEIKDSVTGKVIGYEVTKTTTTTKTGDPVKGDDQVLDSEDREPVTSTPDLPAGVEAGTKDLTDESGKVIGSVETKIEEIKDDAGNVIGYTITEIKTENSHNEGESEATGETTTVNDAPVESIVLPEKPQASESTNTETGVKTVTTVEDIIENGKHVGYKSTTVQTDANGVELSRTSESLFGKTIVVNKSTTTDPTTQTTTTDTTTTTTTVTTIKGTTTYTDVVLGTTQETQREIIEVTENDSWEMVETEDGKVYFMYQGYMYEVLAGEDHGDLRDNVDIDVDFNKYGPNGSNDIRANPRDDGGYTGQILVGGNGNSNGMKYIGYGLYSNFLIRDTDGKGHEVRQYAIKDASGNTSYVYCVELGKALSNGAYYGEYEMTSGSLYANNNGDVVKLNSVAQNGFWGTTSGIGSLEAVKDLLIRNGYKSVADTLTAGQALAATQAAIWEYGTTGTKQIADNNIVFGEYTPYNPKTKEAGFNDSANVSSRDKTNITTLRNLLIDLANNDAGAGIAEKITEADIEGATIVLDKKATNADGTTKTDTQGNELYETDLSFTLAVSTSSISGDLIVEIMQNGKTIETRRLAGDDSKSNYGKIVPVNGVYTIKDIELAEGVNITLNLSGTQHLADGVYIYKNDAVQDFIGLSKLEHEVDLSVDMKFEVTEPTFDLEHNGNDSTKTKNDTYTETRTGSRVDTREDYTTEVDTKTVVEGETVTTVYADVTVVEVTEEVTKTTREWSSEQKTQYTYEDEKPEENDKPDNDPGDNDPGNNDPGNNDPGNNDPGNNDPGNNDPGNSNPGNNVQLLNDDVLILDEDVPLGNLVLQTLPATGDVSALWMILSALSGLGLAAMSLVDRKRKEDE
ncbi:MAG: Cys-Gln thioester bond-forming surface protein [Lachnospiraceae bacterium]|nr:Cys-Gln thioester bond-forming surface protein [Lachnospiraceae bacterium]